MFLREELYEKENILFEMLQGFNQTLSLYNALDSKAPHPPERVDEGFGASGGIQL